MNPTRVGCRGTVALCVVEGERLAGLNEQREEDVQRKNARAGLARERLGCIACHDVMPFIGGMSDTHTMTQVERDWPALSDNLTMRSLLVY